LQLLTQARKTQLVNMKVENMSSTCEMTDGKRRRIAPPTLQALRLTVAPLALPFTKVKKGYGNPLKNTEAVKAGKAKLKERLKEAREQPIGTRKKRMTDRQKRQLEALAFTAES
jgi:hypothetical protein